MMTISWRKLKKLSLLFPFCMCCYYNSKSCNHTSKSQVLTPLSRCSRCSFRGSCARTPAASLRPPVRKPNHQVTSIDTKEPACLISKYNPPKNCFSPIMCLINFRGQRALLGQDMSFQYHMQFIGCKLWVSPLKCMDSSIMCNKGFVQNISAYI